VEAPSAPRKLTFDSSRLSGWDSSLLTSLARTFAVARERGVEVDSSGLPVGLQRLLSLTFAVPTKDTSADTRKRSFVTLLGEQTIANAAAAKEIVTFVGEAVIALGRMLRGRASYRGVDLLEAIQQSGVEALGIVSLISFLVGLILAFVGAVQLEKFGAEIYVADLVGIAMAREMGAIMAGIVMAGRTGAAFAAQLGK
jgi:phospholipid/cholesterol/gamma-HCH transport system permease protein